MKIEEISNHYVQDFLRAVQKEIKAKEVHEKILLELYQHIEDAAFYYMENGMQEEEAWDFAVKSMGNASSIGKELNQTYQKRNPFFPLFIIGISFLIAVLGMIRVIKPYGIFHLFCQKKFLFLIYGGLLLLFIIYSGTIIFKYINFIRTFLFFIWGIYGSAWGIMALFRVFHREGNFLYPCYILINYCYTALYALSLLTILLLVFYELNIKKEIKNSYKSICFFTMVCFLDRQILGSYVLSAVIILTISFIIFLLYFDGNDKRRKWIKISLVLGIFCFFYTPFIYSEITIYQNAKLENNNSEDSILVQSLLKKATNWGTADLVLNTEEQTIWEDSLPKYYQIDYRVTYWILKYGIFPALLLLGIVFGLYIILWDTICKINNKTNRLLASSCFFCLILQFILYLAGNFGFQLGWFCNFPIISEGVSSITVNSIFIGIILTFYRYDRIWNINFSS